MSLDVFRLSERAGLDPRRLQDRIGEAVQGADDGELFLEYRETETFSFDDGRLKQASVDTSQGFGLRAVAGETVGYAHGSELSDEAIGRATAALAPVRSGLGGTIALPPSGCNDRLYTDVSPIGATSLEAKVRLLQDIDAYARAKDPKVRQVTASLAGSWQVVEILRADGHASHDVRPLVRLNVQVVVGDGDAMESGSTGGGGRVGYDGYLEPACWQGMVDEALRQALVKLDAEPAPAGEMTVVLGPGWPGILLHEAIGHGLEGDFNRKKTSAFSGLLGQRVAAPGITVVDDGTLEGRRGSITIDDEGTASNCTVLIEDGILVGYMQDRQNGRLMGTGTTGNGRRQSYAHVPMPRMTNTYMRAGERDPAELIAEAGAGLYATNFGGGQVDITSGKFVFTASEAYRIENGKIGAPVKGATIIGNGADALTKITAVGNDLELDKGIGTCGKEGQWVPVGVGQPTLLIEGLTIGGTAVKG
ncbi:metalloprotease TldD [Marinivivus vitaminiproducens]|uniref:metalloprotease TldD n=1 Tax=Marinivivus vitaminiproducens TaxID=3035935 RepID=UPI0027A1A750|nr:metalloprotease TldD [Geminicoccaceae bacterium SCSIO 64248]